MVTVVIRYTALHAIKILKMSEQMFCKEFGLLTLSIPINRAKVPMRSSSLFVAGPMTWNSLPRYLHDSVNDFTPYPFFDDYLRPKTFFSKYKCKHRI